MPCCLISKLISCSEVQVLSLHTHSRSIHCVCGTQRTRTDTAPSSLPQVWEKGGSKLLPPEQLIHPVLFPEVISGSQRALDHIHYFPWCPFSLKIFFQPCQPYHGIAENRERKRRKKKDVHKDKSQKKVAAAPKWVPLPLHYLLSILRCLTRLSYKRICTIPIPLT